MIRGAPAGTGEAQPESSWDIYEHLKHTKHSEDGSWLLGWVCLFDVLDITSYPQMHLHIKYVQKPARGSVLLCIHHE